MLPEGTYAAAVVPVETDSGKLSIQFGPGTEKSPFTAVLSFEVIRGPQSGQTISAFLYFSSTADKKGRTVMERSLESLRVCGFKGDDLDKFADQHPDQEVSIVVEHETYEGTKRARVRWINAPHRGFVLSEPLAAKELRTFSAQMKNKLKATKEVAGKKAEREAPTPETPSEEGSGWSGNDSPDPPSDARFQGNAGGGANDDLPF